MKTYARIQNGAVMEIVSTAGDITTMFHPDLVWVDVTANNPQPVPGSSAVENGDIWTFSPPGGPTPAQLWAGYQAQAVALLAESDRVANRCYKAGVAFPAAWLAYVQALRSILRASSGDPTQAMPVAPVYPAGT
ncbi:MAG: hypothetical protein ABSH41_27635 [Syntrophobacteraceae bacterium]